MKPLALALMFLATATFGEPRSITLASTTSTQNSGLYAHILPLFEADTGIHVNVVAVGTGQALRIAQNGDADALVVHHRPSEDAFVAAGFGIDRRDVMYNDFILVGPKSDPAGISGLPDAAAVLTRLAETGSLFISRGDESGTHLREREIWAKTGLTPSGRWYREIGAGMGAALNMAAVTDGYVLTDRGTWLSFGNRRGLVTLFEGDPVLHNPYGVIRVNPDRYPHIDAQAALALADWLTSARGQAAIGEFKVDGRQLFCPVANTAPPASRCPDSRKN